MSDVAEQDVEQREADSPIEEDNGTDEDVKQGEADHPTEEDNGTDEAVKQGEADRPTQEDNGTDKDVKQGTDDTHKSQNAADRFTIEEAELEEMFKDRYTEKDEAFMKTLAKDLPPPPCVENWYTRPKRNFAYNRDSRGHQGQGYRGDNRNRTEWDRDKRQDYNRYKGQGHYRDQGYHRDQGHYYDNRNEDRGYGQRQGGHGYRDNRNDGDRYRPREHDSDRVHYAGMKRYDGTRERDSRYQDQPYNRDRNYK